ncbi:hypothetical protein LTR08_004150 [Meristemomyces frigidus]|nr:hypothetical protein LTR08_004150 [Meristemomyces frigidus]
MAGYEAPNVADIDANGEEVPPTALPEQLNITIRDFYGAQLGFRLRPTTKMGKAMNAFASRTNREVRQLRFLFEGHRLNVDDTVETLEMEDGDNIDVHLEQIGGGEGFGGGTHCCVG